MARIDEPLTFARTRDFALVREIITQPAQWKAATDDAAPAREEWQPNPDERIYYLFVEADEMVGIFTLLPQNAASYEIHAAFMRRSRSSRRPHDTTAEMARAAIAWAFAHMPARRVVASIPATNRAAIRAAERAGMTRFGTNARSFLKRGELVDQVLLGISPQDLLSQ